MKKHLPKRIVSMLLVLALLLSIPVPVSARDSSDSESSSLRFDQIDGVSAAVDESLKAEAVEEEVEYDPDEVVRASIVLERASTLDAGYSTQDIAGNAAALSYRDSLKEEQVAVTAKIEAALDVTLDVQWNLTLAANVISVNVEYGMIEDIEKVPGVKEVILETRYDPCVVDQEETADPNMATSPNMVGVSNAYSVGYTGAGSRVAIVDTGIDMDHESMSAAGFEYSLAYQAGLSGMDLDEYIESLDLLDAEEINGLLDQLNVSQISAELTGESLYKTSKIAFGFNYIDKTESYIDHNKDRQGGHGSHVAGIAAANAYVPNDDGTFSSALGSGKVQGIAPDAQILIMKVFGQGGGAYESDYIAAIEDAIVLGCDSVNLSLGTAAHGYTRNTTYPEVLEKLVESDTVVVMSAGNNGNWADAGLHNNPGYLYPDDVSMHTGGAPGTYTNTMSVASVDNDGGTGYYISVDDRIMFYSEGAYSDAAPLYTIAGEYDYIFLDGVGTEEEFAAIGPEVLTGKIAICSRGTTSFYEKAEAAVNNGAAATIIYNNQTATINMDLSDYTKTAPCVAITKADGAAIKAASTAVTDEAGNVLYYTGKITISGEYGTTVFDSDYYTMSSFSSYGVTGSLELKPEIAAPGGNIYSLDGETDGGTSYTNMSGTSMAAPQISGMAALVGQFIDENGLQEKTGVSKRALIQSLLMSTAVPMEESEGAYYPVFRQGAGLANVGSAVNANSYILMGEDATESYADGKVKVELKDDPQRTGVYEFSFSLNNLNDSTQQYMLSADLFTQGLFTDGTCEYLDTATTDLQAQVIWTVNGTELQPAGDVSKYDFNGDGLVNGDDVQALLDYVVGSRESITNEELADLDASGDIATYDAYLLLHQLSTGLLTLEPGDKTEIHVKIVLTQEQKALLDASYENGAYVEGYLFAKQLTTEEGVVGTSHSIPLLGFYGNWSDPSMFDHGTYATTLYGDQGLPYTGIEDRNTMILRYYGSSDLYYSVGNPYCVEDEYPAGREAISMRTTICQQLLTAIRDPAALTMLITNQDGEYLFAGDPVIQVGGAYYYGGWLNNNNAYNMYRKVSTLGVEEGDVITISVVAIPELYEEDGDLTLDQIKELVESGTLGDGAFLSNTYTIDSQAPEMLSIYKDLTTGNLIVESRDNNYVAAVQVQSKGGTIYGTVAPKQTTTGEVTRVEVDLSAYQGKIGQECMVVIGDYAKNETAYVVNYGEEPQDDTGKFFYYTDTSYRGSGQRWVTMDPSQVWYYYGNYSGTEDVSTSPIDVTAGDYVGGYVFMASSDGYYYVSKHGDWADCTRVGYWKDTATSIRAMTYSYGDNTMYALGSTDRYGRNSALFSVDLLTGETTLLATLTLNRSVYPMNMMASDDEGNLYGVNFGLGGNSYLYKFDPDDIVDGKLTVSPMTNTAIGIMSHYGCLAWDHDNDEMYMASCMSYFGSDSGSPHVAKIDMETGKGTKTCEDTGGYSEWSASRLADCPFAMYIVPSETVALKPSKEATGIEMTRNEVTGLVGTTFDLSTTVYPWNLADKTVTWTTSDASVATVAEGKVAMVGVGTATITATTNNAPNLTATCTVTVEELPNIKLSALITDAEGKSYWSDFETDDPSGWTPVSSETASYRGGALLDDVIYVHDNSHLYGVDPDTFEVTDFGELASDWHWTDAAPLPATGGLESGVVGIANGRIALLDAEGGVLRYFSAPGGSDPTVAIAYVGEGIYNYNNSTQYPAQYYYILSEDGVLYRAYVYVSGDLYCFGYEQLGSTGLILDGVSNLMVKRYASMVYDQASGYLLLSVHTTGNANQLYAINPETLLPTKLGEFGDGTYPVVSLYQYSRYTELTVKMKTTEVSLFAEDTLQLNTRVLPVKYNNEITWTSSDPSVATVDQTGKVTALKEGVAVITATSVDVNESGEHATATCTVTVRDLTPLSIKVSAQVVTADGTKWVTIDTATRAVTENAANVTTLTGAGVHDGLIYGTSGDLVNAGNLYRVDPSNGYQETKGTACDPYYAFRDGSTLPAKDVVVTDWSGNAYERTAYGYPFYITNSNILAMLTDFTDGSLLTMRWPNNNEEAAAIAYAGDSTWTNWAGTVFETKVSYVITTNGMLYQFIMFPTYYYYAPNNLSYSSVAEAVGNLGITFEDPSKLTMTYLDDGTNRGLVVGYAGEKGVEVYYVDLSGETPICGKVCNLPEATDICGLYVDAKVSQSSIPGVVAGTETTISSPISYARNVAQVQEFTEASLTEPLTQTNAVTAETQDEEVTPASVVVDSNCTDNTFTLTLTVDEATTNGLIAVDYDASVLTLQDVSSTLAYHSIRSQEGTVTLGFADAGALPAGTALVSLRFAVKEPVETTFTIRTLENGSSKEITTETVTLTVPQHDYVATVTEPTCTEGGCTVYVCARCGESYTGDYTEPLGHDFHEWVVTVEATCTEDGQEIRSCARCGEVETRIIPADCPSAIFRDVLPKAWYHTAVDYVIENGIMVGVGDGLFAPDGVTTRAQVVMVLYRLAGEPETEKTHVFEDVSENAWYAEAVAWANANGITKGVTATRFVPDAPVTREQVAAFLARYAALTGVNTEAEGDLSRFTDGNTVSKYAVNAMTWAVDNGIILGMNDATLSPKSGSTRAQIAAILMRFLEMGK